MNGSESQGLPLEPSNIESKIIGFFTGDKAALPDNSKQKFSGIKKKPQDRLIIEKDGIVGDAVLNRKYHGGELRVVHQFPLEYYEVLKKTFPDAAHKFIPGSIGENISTTGVTEKELCVGDIFRLGTALIQVTVPRIPCNTTDINYQVEGVLKTIFSAKGWGWFYRVVESGACDFFSETSSASSSNSSPDLSSYLKFIERPYPDLNLKELMEITFFTTKLNQGHKEFLKKALATELMDPLGFEKKIEGLIAEAD